MLNEHVEELEDNKDAMKICFYMFWKHNRNVGFFYLGDAYVVEEVECLECLAKEESEAAAKVRPLQILRRSYYFCSFIQVLPPRNL